MKIVILDGYSVSQDDLGWDCLEELADVEVYDRTSEDDIISRCKGAEIVLTNKVVLSAEILNMLPRLQYIGVLATGYNVVDLEQATRQNITVTNIPAYSTESVAQMVFCHLLNIVGQVGHYAEENKKGRWSQSADFCYLDHNLFELNGKKMGIIGLGNTGMATARIATAFGLKVYAYTSKDEDDLPEGIRKADLDDVFTECDIVSLHCPLTPDTHHIINRQRLASMKDSAILINTGRGPLVDDEALAEALENDVIAAYGADVLTTEPAPADNPLLKAPNCYLTPHIAWATREARMRLINTCKNNIQAFIDGDPINVVNDL
ncbi:MAG: D-2-hydroxyacid dehydrogenase [Bacteroidaceae bacterium]|nr:D-2-hydroxyacid dehydrogenase [Bacteroidaceae bacterium]